MLPTSEFKITIFKQGLETTEGQHNQHCPLSILSSAFQKLLCKPGVDSLANHFIVSPERQYAGFVQNQNRIFHKNRLQ